MTRESHWHGHLLVVSHTAAIMLRVLYFLFSDDVNPSNVLVSCDVIATWLLTLRAVFGLRGLWLCEVRNGCHWWQLHKLVWHRRALVDLLRLCLAVMNPLTSVGTFRQLTQKVDLFCLGSTTAALGLTVDALDRCWPSIKWKDGHFGPDRRGLDAGAWTALFAAAFAGCAGAMILSVLSNGTNESTAACGFVMLTKATSASLLQLAGPRPSLEVCRGPTPLSGRRERNHMRTVAVVGQASTRLLLASFLLSLCDM